MPTKKSPIEHHPEAPQGKQWWLRGLNTGKVLGKHATRAEALAQLRAVEKSMRG
jgi:hypothetical protein